jgi:hypothetical protein
MFLIIKKYNVLINNINEEELIKKRKLVMEVDININKSHETPNDLIESIVNINTRRELLIHGYNETKSFIENNWKDYIK